MCSKSHHFLGIAAYANQLMDLAEGLPVFTGRGKRPSNIAAYANQLMDLAEGLPVFTGRGKRPSNKEVLAAIVCIKKCRKNRQQGSFFSTNQREKTCSCGWHIKAAARKLSKEASSSASILQPPAFHQPPVATIVRGPITFEPPLATARKVPATRKASSTSLSVS